MILTHHVYNKMLFKDFIFSSTGLNYCYFILDFGNNYFFLLQKTEHPNAL